MKKILTLCAAALIAVSVYAAHYPEITIDGLKSAIASKSVTLLDANGTDSYKDGHIPGQSISRQTRLIWPKSCPRTKMP